MEQSPAPASVQPESCETPQSSNALVPMVDSGMTLGAVATPSPGNPELSKFDKPYLTKMMKVVEFKEMDMAALCSHSGIGACLKTMADDERNPILLDGEHCWRHQSWCRAAPALRLVLLRCEPIQHARRGVRRGSSLIGVAWMPIHQAWHALWPKTPCEDMKSPFDPKAMVDGVYPQLSTRLRCHCHHGPEYEEMRNHSDHFFIHMSC